MEIVRITPNTFNGPRAYFTAFDHRIVSRTDDLNLLKRQVERKLKILLLIKSKIVCAASHLTSHFAYDIFKQNPFLLNEGHIVPALRSDKIDIAELFEKMNNKDELIKFYNDNIKITVSWQLEDNSLWFKNQFVSEFQNENSLVRKQLSNVSSHNIAKIVQDVQSGDILSREKIDNTIKDLPDYAKLVVLNFRELIYHMSGARVVNCESSLPQENYIDYDLADIQQKRTKLSEEQILWKMFVELILDSFQKHVLDIECLDMLTFKDIIQIKQPLFESKFQESYDKLINQVISDAHKNKNELFFNINELELIRKNLENTFKSVFQDQLPNFLKKRAISQAKQLGSVGASVALGVLGFVPALGTLSGVISLLKDSPALLFNIGQTYSSLESISDFNKYLLMKENAIKGSIEKSDLNDKSIMIDMVELLMATVSNKIAL